MAAKKMYAWSDIKYSTTNDAGLTQSQVLRCGREAVQNKMGLNDEQWEELVTTKAIRPNPYPVPLNTTNPVSPVTHFRRLARAIESGADDPALLDSVLPPIQDTNTAAQAPA